ncbi:MAG TPA: hypothetical protein DCQ06_07650 [Myxococcales bacterium]|nr:hypothetical protein [Myxococcales bacterium]
MKRVFKVVLSAAILALVALPAGATVPAPTAVTQTAQSLLFDIKKLVELTEQRGWTIRSYELRRLMPDTLMSVCRVEPEVRRRTLAMLRAAHKAAGGSPIDVWKKEGKMSSRMVEMLTLDRSEELLSMAVRAAEKQCPFYLQTDPHFRGRHRDGSALFLSTEGGGAFAVRHTDKWIFGGGGRGRVMMGRGFGSNLSLRAGVELGGAALVDERFKTDDVQIDLITAVPVVLRQQSGIYVWDAEVAGITYGIPGRDVMRYGARVGALFGVSALRIRAVLPWTGLLVTAEYVFPRGPLPGQWTVRTGFVVGFNLNL